MRSRLQKKYDKLLRRTNKYRRANFCQIFDKESEHSVTLIEMELRLKSLKETIRLYKLSSLSDRIHTSSKTGNSRKFFKLIEQFQDDYKPRTQKFVKALKDRTGKIVRSTDEIHNSFLEYWKTIFSKDDPISASSLRSSWTEEGLSYPRYRRQRQETKYF